MFVGVHAKYHEITPIIMSVGLGLLMAFIAYGRMVLKPISQARKHADRSAFVRLAISRRENRESPSLSRLGRRPGSPSPKGTVELQSSHAVRTGDSMSYFFSATNKNSHGGEPESAVPTGLVLYAFESRQ